MSYHVRFEVRWSGDGFGPRGKKAREALLSCVEEYLGIEGSYEADQWLDEFRKAFLGEEAQIKNLGEEWAIGLVKFASGRFPGVTFEARGIGEELEDAWAFRCLDGEIPWEASFEGQREGMARESAPGVAWPGPVEVPRVVVQAGSRRFIAEILAEQPPGAQVAGLTIEPSGGRRPRALVYVGPLTQEGYERVRDLIDDRYRVQQFRDPKGLAKPPTATADDPRGY